MRGLLRFVGVLLLAGGFIFLIYDGTRSIADKALRMTPFSQSWSDIHQASFLAFQPWVENLAGPNAWAVIRTVVLSQPTFAVLGVLGVLVILAVPSRKPVIGYGRD